MQLRDLQKQYQALKPQMDEAISEVVSAGTFIQGAPVKELESQLAAYVGTSQCVTCANGTDALRLALMIWNIGPGDAVFVPDFTFFASAEVVASVGATPIFVDVVPSTFNIDCVDLEKKIQQTIMDGKLKARVIIAVDLFGQPADFLPIREIADIYQLFVLEDAAQGFGGSIGKDRACSFGDIAATSFFPAKPLGCYGDGGAIFTNRVEWAETARSFCVHGKGAEKYDNVRIGMNSRLDTLQAAVLQVKLAAFPEELNRVNMIAERYTRGLSDVVVCPQVPQSFRSSWAQYTIRLASQSQRDALQSYLKSAAIPTAIYYPRPMHQQTAFSYLNSPAEDCPNAVQLSQTVLSLPMHPYLTDEEADLVVSKVKGFLSK